MEEEEGRCIVQEGKRGKIEDGLLTNYFSKLLEDCVNTWRRAEFLSVRKTNNFSQHTLGCPHATTTFLFFFTKKTCKPRKVTLLRSKT